MRSLSAVCPWSTFHSFSPPVLRCSSSHGGRGSDSAFSPRVDDEAYRTAHASILTFSKNPETASTSMLHSPINPSVKPFRVLRNLHHPVPHLTEFFSELSLSGSVGRHFPYVGPPFFLGASFYLIAALIDSSPMPTPSQRQMRVL